MLFIFLFCQQMVMTVDDLPGAGLELNTEVYREIMGKMEAVFVRHNVPAIGFVNEFKLYKDEELLEARVAILRSWFDAGLELGNHGYQHLDLHTVPLQTYLDDIVKGEKITRQLLAEKGQSPRYYRHPFLHTGKTVEAKEAVGAVLEKHGYLIAPVTIDNSEWIYARAFDRAVLQNDENMQTKVGQDYVRYMLEKTAYFEQQSQVMFQREIPQILLIHANRLNAAYGEALVQAIKKRGYSFISLAQALKDEAYSLKDEWFGHAGITWLHRWVLAKDRSLLVPNEPKTPQWVLEQAQIESE